MSSNKKRSNNRASKSKQRQIYTPDTAPIVYSDTPILSENNESDQKTIESTDVVETIKQDESYKSSATQKEESKNESDNKVTKDLSFLTNRVPCRFIGRTPLRNKTLSTIRELIDVILNNSLGMYSIVTTNQVKNLIVNAIRTLTNFDLNTNLTEQQKEERIKRFEEDMKMYKL